MFIERDDHRWWRFALSGGFFIALMLLIMFNSSVLTMIDAVLQSLFLYSCIHSNPDMCISYFG